MYKFLSIITGVMLTLSVSADGDGNKVELRTVDLTDSTLAFTSRMNDGKFITALSVTEVRVFTKRCLADPVAITLNGLPQDVKEVLWCKWDPVRQAWELIDKPKPVMGDNGHIVWQEKVTCPGFYGYFSRPQGIPKGVKIKVPSRYHIDWLRLEQGYPMAFREEQHPKTPGRECMLTVGDIRFDTFIVLQVSDKNGKIIRLPGMLAGRYLDFMEEPDANGYRHLSIPEEAFELAVEPLTIKTN